MLLTCEFALCAIEAFVCSDGGSSLQFAVVASGTDITKVSNFDQIAIQNETKRPSILPVLPVDSVGVLAGGAPPCLLVPLHQAVSQSLEAHCLHQKLVLMATRHTPAVAGGTFSRLDSFLFQEGEGVGRGLRSACYQLV